MKVVHDSSAPHRREARSRCRFCHGLLLASLSLVAGLAICEATLRIAYPRYQHLASPPISPVERLAEQQHQSRNRSARTSAFHRPDSGEMHALLYNKLGNRQHRDFSDRDLRERTNVAFFGDSFTENRYIAAHYSFPEVLDYLLGHATRHDELSPINVLNFGFEGTGPGFQYAHYDQIAKKLKLEHVFYVFCNNDIDDLRENALFNQEAKGLVDYVRGRPIWRRWLSGFHVSYLVLDVWHRVKTLTSPRDAGDMGIAEPDLDVASNFRDVVLKWRAEVEANGGEFYVVILPLPGAAQLFAKIDWPQSLTVLDLDPCFKAAFPDGTGWRFKTDSHWNEAGNMVAADCLYRFLERRLEFPAAQDKALAEARHVYYQAFAQDPGWSGYRWTPSPPWVKPRRFSVQEAAAIRAKYASLRSNPQQRLVDWAGEREPDARGGGWNVHIALPKVFYVKADCGQADPTAHLFLRALAPSSDFRMEEDPATPHAEGDPHRRSTQGVFVEIPLGMPNERTMWRQGRECYVLRDFDYQPLAQVQTGEYQQRLGGTVLWEETITVNSAQEVAKNIAPYRARYMALAEREPVARSRWNVHVSGLEIAYLKEPCDSSDLDDPFFLRLLPATSAKDSVRKKRHRDGFVWHKTVDFRKALMPTKNSSMFDDKCILRLLLPEWPVATVSTGQRHADDDSVLWDATFHLDIQRFQHAYESAGADQRVVRSAFDIYHVDGELVYIREVCTLEDTQARFFLHVSRESGEPEAAGESANMDFDFDDRGMRYEGRCVAVVPLPSYPVGRVRTGQFAAGAQVWETMFNLDIQRFQRAYQTAGAGQRVVRSAFDIYRVDGELVYVRETCAAEDTQARFFLHVFRESSGPEATGEPANMDFDFGDRGMRYEGRCVAVVPLPSYPVDRIRTGQFAAGTQVWAAEF